jgi:N-acetylglutamate synthase-like GNAT family acetyltransferase
VEENLSLQFIFFEEAQSILKETFSIWSGGLSQFEYRHYIWRQLHHPWGKRHIRYVALKRNGKILSSCKLYDLTFASRGELFRMNYIGAVFTAPALRGNGYGKAMLAKIISYSEEAGFDGVYLFSDVGSDYYEDLGFEAFGNDDFLIELERQSDIDVFDGKAQSEPGIDIFKNDKIVGSVINGSFQPGVKSDLITQMSRHHERWLRQQPFGIKRGYDYLHFKLCKEYFLREHSALSWPDKLFFVKQNELDTSAYAIAESAGATLRILEVIGSIEDRKAIWRALLSFARNNYLRRIRGWEAVVSDFAPSFSFGNLYPYEKQRFKGQILSYERSWGLPMFIPFNPKLDTWPNFFPCPFLELDHF